ncbi:MAG: hypothetical protein Q9190_006796 [Brigantiaea leucoxantha]
MVFNTVSVSTAVTPAVIETCFSHYLKRKPLRQKPTAHISYHEGLALIRRFLYHASFHTVEEIQAFTAQWVPSPRWVKVDEVTIPENIIEAAADAIIEQLGHKGVDKDPSTIILAGDSAGAGMILSVLVILRDRGISLPAGAVLISPWVDLTHSFPSVAGDSSLDFIPSHGFLARPSAAWPPPNADDMEQIAMHAVEKVVGEAMPRKSSQHERQVAHDEAVQGFAVDKDPGHLDPQSNADNPAGTKGAGTRPGNTIPGPGHDLSIMLDGSLVTIKDQIQMYTTNQLSSHPLVSPVLQPSLGGLPPLLILTGGGELLRDEQIYLAHKAASPAKYPPGEAYLNEYPDARDIVHKWKPTDVQLQVWDDLCHVAPTLSFTRPAKFMYRSIAQFGAWALARAQKTDIEIIDDDDVSVISSASSSSSEMNRKSDTASPEDSKQEPTNSTRKGLAAHQDGQGRVGRAGEPLPAFKAHMIRQRVDRHGNIYPLAPASELPALQVPANEIGVIKPGPVRKWMNAKKEWDTRFAKEKRKVQRKRVEEMAMGFQGFGDDDVPPPSALAGRRELAPKQEGRKRVGSGGGEEKRGRSWGMSLWSFWGGRHDEKAIEREEKADKVPGTYPTAMAEDTRQQNVEGTTSSTTTKGNKFSRPRSKSQSQSRSRSRRRIVSYTPHSPSSPSSTPPSSSKQNLTTVEPSFPIPNTNTTIKITQNNRPVLTTSTSNTITTSDSTKAAGTFPFKLASHLHPNGGLGEVNASTVTLRSERMGMETPGPTPGWGQQSGNGYFGEKGEKEGARKERPGIERFETAREEVKS